MLSKIIQFFKHYWVFILLAAITGGLVMLRISQKQLPLPTILPKPTPQPFLTKPTIAGFKIPTDSKLTVITFSFPSQLKTYQGQKNKISSEKAIKIAQEFNFTQPPQVSEDVSLGKFYAWTSEAYSLSIGFEAGEVSYGRNLYQSEPPTHGTLPSPQSTRSTLENLLVKLELTPQFEPKWQKEEYLVHGYYLQLVATPQKADFIRIGFNPGINQYQLVGLNPNEPLVSLTLGKGGETIYFRYQVYFSDFEGRESYELKTKEEVQRTLTTEGKIVYAGTFKKTTKEPEITQADFNQIQLAYFQEPEKSQIIQPIYILSGRGTLTNGEETEIIAYLPAISSKWFKPEQEHFRF